MCRLDNLCRPKSGKSLFSRNLRHAKGNPSSPHPTLVGSQGVQSLESIDVLRFCVFSRLDDISEGSKPRGFYLFGLEETRKQWGDHTSWIWGNGQAMMVRPLVSPTAWEPDGAGVILLWTKWICRRAEVASTYTICAQPMASWDPQTRKAYEKSHLKERSIRNPKA